MTTHTEPRHVEKANTSEIKKAIEDLVARLRTQIKGTTDPRAQALFETTAEALKGLVTAFNDYEAGTETAFRRQD